MFLCYFKKCVYSLKRGQKYTSLVLLFTISSLFPAKLHHLSEPSKKKYGILFK